MARTRPQSLTISPLIKSLPFCLPATKLSQAENKPFPYQRAKGSIDFQARRFFLFRNFEAKKRERKRVKEREKTPAPLPLPSGKLLLTFNLFRQEMESYILTTVNRGTGKERCNQAAQLQGLHSVTFNSHSDHTICSAWYAHAIPITENAAISSSSSSFPSSYSSLSSLITTENFHTSLVPRMKQITKCFLPSFYLSIGFICRWWMI